MSGDILIGIDFWKDHKEKQQVPVFWRESNMSNHHVGVFGTSGAGKTHWIRQFINGMADDVEIDLFDYHDDIHVPGAKSVIFSEATQYGYNPLVLNIDPHYGGVRRAINDVIHTMSQSARILGVNQEGVMRNLLTDTYMQRGIFNNRPQTWLKHNATDAEIQAYADAKNWEAWRGTYPTMVDVIRLAQRKVRALWMRVEDEGTGRASMFAFDDYCRAIKAFKQAATTLRHDMGDRDRSEAEKKIASTKDKALQAYSTYLDTVESGRELNEAIKYGNKDVLLSVVTRLENLVATGLFNANPPPFGNARIRRYVLKPMAQSPDEMIMFVHFRLHEICREMMQKGESGGRLRR